MTLEELRSDLLAILAAEEAAQPNWADVQSLSLGTIARLCAEPEPAYPHEVVYHFLDDADIRRRDLTYAKVQRDRLRAWLSVA